MWSSSGLSLLYNSKIQNQFLKNSEQVLRYAYWNTNICRPKFSASRKFYWRATQTCWPLCNLFVIRASPFYKPPLKWPSSYPINAFHYKAIFGLNRNLWFNYWTFLLIKWTFWLLCNILLCRSGIIWLFSIQTFGQWVCVEAFE